MFAVRNTLTGSMLNAQCSMPAKTRQQLRQMRPLQILMGLHFLQAADGALELEFQPLAPVQLQWWGGRRQD